MEETLMQDRQPTPPPQQASLRQSNQSNFSRDLEFLSSLANPFYLNSLALQGHLEDPSFLRYLRHLNYFRHPSYAKFLLYPQALHFLELLQYPEFRQIVRDPVWANDTASKQIAHWATWREPRLSTTEQADKLEIEKSIRNGSSVDEAEAGRDGDEKGKGDEEPPSPSEVKNKPTSTSSPAIFPITKSS
ncbi:SOH1-domain-containing protein [Violaceomyces palustris]|uniref:SOH1-domain-containing protein n=1 Tax=Violaceomyces palustris TaxID=1673888 RepID=A0ACD0P7W4_9BASI|nr:SOH1-domain-containing protein [Violaceomyces palustris]